MEKEIIEEENPGEHAGRNGRTNAYDEWVNSIRRKIPGSSSKPNTPRPTIFRVPEHIRGGNENAYEPQVVSIGPYHRAKVKFVDEHKWRYVQAILERNPKKSLEDYLNGIKELEDRARSCYQETTEIRKIGSNDFVEMMFVDGCFMVELLLKQEELFEKRETTETEDDIKEDDIIYRDQLLMMYLINDLRLLENQIPYFILERIFERVMSNKVDHFKTFLYPFEFFPFIKKILSSDEANPSNLSSALLMALALRFISSGFDANIRSFDVADGAKVSFHHLLHLFHYSLSPHSDFHSKETPAKSNFQKLKNAIASKFSRLYCYGSTSSAGEIPEQSRSPANSTSNTLKNIIRSTFSHLCSQVSASSSGETPLQLSFPSKSMFEKLKVDIRSIFPCLHSRSEHVLLSVPSVTKLKEAGVRFWRAENPGSILNIKFDGGVMEIPHLFIDDSTNFFFRNLIAFEQCHQGVPRYFSSYAALMDYLINTPKDVEILSHNWIIEHALGSDEEVALLFNRLGKGVLVNLDDGHLSTIFNDVKNYCSKCWPRHRETLCRKYFSSPWAALSVAAAVILLFLTVIQTVCLFSQYFSLPC